MKKLLVVRHGQCERGDIYWGTSDVALSPSGIETARKLGSLLQAAPIDLIFHSPQYRARQTGEIVRETLGKDIPLMPEPGVAAKDYGIFNGRPKSEVARFRAYSTEREMLVWAPDGGESYCAIFVRVASFLQRIANSAGHGCLVVTHEGIVKVFNCLLYKSLLHLARNNDHGELSDFSALLIDLPRHRRWLDEIQGMLGLPAIVEAQRERRVGKG